MRISDRRTHVLLANRPFQGGPGISLYVGTPAATAIRYRRFKAVCPGVPWRPVSTETIDPGAATVPKCRRVGSVTSPTTSIDYTLPAELVNVPLAVNVRTYQNDYENESIYRQVITSTDSGGDGVDSILGSALILSVNKRDAGGVLVRFVYTAARDGLQPDQFALVQTSGPGSLDDAVIDSTSRENSIEITGLTDGATYGWRLEARNGAVTANLGTVSFTADATGPADPTGVIAVPL